MPAYTKQDWEDGSAGGTPITAARLDYMEDGIAGAVQLDREDANTSGADAGNIAVVTPTPAAVSGRISVATGGKVVLGAGVLADISGVGGHVVGTVGWVELNAPGRTVTTLIGAEGKLDLVAGTCSYAIAQESQVNQNTAAVSNIYLNFNHVVSNSAAVGVIAGSIFQIDANSAPVTYAAAVYAPTVQNNTSTIDYHIGLFYGNQPAKSPTGIKNKKVVWNLDAEAEIDTAGPVIASQFKLRDGTVITGGGGGSAITPLAVRDGTMAEFPGVTVTGISTFENMIANTIFWMPFQMQRAGTLTRVVAGVAQAGSGALYKMLAYAGDVNGGIGALLGQSGDFSAAATGSGAWSGLTIPFAAGDVFWLALWHNDGTVPGMRFANTISPLTIRGNGVWDTLPLAYRLTEARTWGTAAADPGPDFASLTKTTGTSPFRYYLKPEFSN